MMWKYVLTGSLLSAGSARCNSLSAINFIEQHIFYSGDDYLHGSVSFLCVCGMSKIRNSIFQR